MNIVSFLDKNGAHKNKVWLLLRTLHMRNTQRNGTNIPTNLEGLVHLTDVDLSENSLTRIPEGLLKVPNLKRVNLGSNQIDQVSPDIEKWSKLETFILSRNQIKSLPPALCKLSKVRKNCGPLNKGILENSGIYLGRFNAGFSIIFSIPRLCLIDDLQTL